MAAFGQFDLGQIVLYLFIVAMGIFLITLFSGITFWIGILILVFGLFGGLITHCWTNLIGAVTVVFKELTRKK